MISSHGELAPGGVGPLPAAELIERGAQHPPTDGHDLPAALGEGDEVERRHRRTVRFAPTQEGLEAGDDAVGEPDRRLVHEVELIVGQRTVEPGAQAQPIEDAVVHGRLEGAETAAALGLGVVHRRVRVAQQRHDVGVLTGDA